MSSSDSELEEDEEEILVYVEFDNCGTNDMFSTENLKLDMLGLDSDHPIMQVNGKFFEGTYEDAIGTYLFFEKDVNPVIDDPVFDKVPTLKYFKKTRKLLKMQRAFVVPRYEVLGDSNHSQSIPNKNTIKAAGVPPKYQEDAFAFWENARNKRITALNEYLRKQEFRKELRLRGFEPESESDEDNPFAIYKYIENESKVAKTDDQNIDYESQIEKLENTLQMTELGTEQAKNSPKKLTVIDPGPSTSKSSMPWIEDDVPKSQSMAQKVKSIGKVKEKIIKGKVEKKILRKKKFSISHKLLNETSNEQSLENSDDKNEFYQEDSEKSIKNDEVIDINKLDEADKVEDALGTKLEEMEIDEIAIENSERLLANELKLNDSFISDKNKKKQEKREAKMREISEKLKALSQPSKAPNS
ncbi:PREDICTED: uncharacterized protein LOC105364367 [Ceratosolen solmsi marchali]|uniref:Uncharacterized protein LOC105364367 n=1 Tax=Ceratosolen solmsi marchali TaxID=326594 RepID=A0AAJ6YM48_9HYME|nr:PREDICTED: uncharacterized protein LOC105364367 [Ceratosolen solmsi marchali]